MKLRIPAALAAIAIALTGCGGGDKETSTAASTVKPSPTATKRPIVPDLAGKTVPEATSTLADLNYRVRIMGADGRRWSNATIPDNSVITLSTQPAAGGSSANEFVDIKVGITENDFLAAAKSQAAEAAVAEAEAKIATRYTYTCGGVGQTTDYKNYKDVWAGSNYKDAGPPCRVTSYGDLLPSEQEIVDAVASKGVEIKDPGMTVDRIMGLCAKLDNTWGASYFDKPTSTETKAEAAAALTVCPDAPHAAALQEGATVSKITDGTKVVGQTMEAGTWKTKPGVKLCYWSRSAGNGDIIVNDIIDFAPDGVTVTVYPGEGFKSDRCGTWSKIG